MYQKTRPLSIYNKTITLEESSFRFHQTTQSPVRTSDYNYSDRRQQSTENENRFQTDRLDVNLSTSSTI